MAITDVGETLEGFDQLETCRGTILINPNMVKRAIGKLHNAVNVKSDFYYQDNTEKLQELIGTIYFNIF